jgi:hypothetical protein
MLSSLPPGRPKGSLNVFRYTYDDIARLSGLSPHKVRQQAHRRARQYDPRDFVSAALYCLRARFCGTPGMLRFLDIVEESVRREKDG